MTISFDGDRPGDSSASAIAKDWTRWRLSAVARKELVE
jgi:hypothetical protein